MDTDTDIPVCIDDVEYTTVVHVVHVIHDSPLSNLICFILRLALYGLGVGAVLVLAVVVWFIIACASGY